MIKSTIPTSYAYIPMEERSYPGQGLMEQFECEQDSARALPGPFLLRRPTLTDFIDRDRDNRLQPLFNHSVRARVPWMAGVRNSHQYLLPRPRPSRRQGPRVYLKYPRAGPSRRFDSQHGQRTTPVTRD